MRMPTLALTKVSFAVDLGARLFEEYSNFDNVKFCFNDGTTTFRKIVNEGRHMIYLQKCYISRTEPKAKVDKEMRKFSKLLELSLLDNQIDNSDTDCHDKERRLFLPLVTSLSPESSC